MTDTSREGEATPKGRALPDRLLMTSAALAALEKRVAALAMFVIMGAITATIVVRILDLPLLSLGEIAVVAMSPLTFIGGAYCSHMHRHITIDLVELLADGPVKTVLHLLASASMVVFAGVFAWLTWDFLAYAFTSGESLIDLGTPVAIPVGCMFLGAALMGVHAIIDILMLLLTGRYGTRT